MAPRAFALAVAVWLMCVGQALGKRTGAATTTVFGGPTDEDCDAGRDCEWEQCGGEIRKKRHKRPHHFIENGMEGFSDARTKLCCSKYGAMKGCPGVDHAIMGCKDGGDCCNQGIACGTDQCLKATQAAEHAPAIYDILSAGKQKYCCNHFTAGPHCTGSGRDGRSSRKRRETGGSIPPEADCDSGKECHWSQCYALNGVAEYTDERAKICCNQQGALAGCPNVENLDCSGTADCCNKGLLCGTFQCDQQGIWRKFWTDERKEFCGGQGGISRLRTVAKKLMHRH